MVVITQGRRMKLNPAKPAKPGHLKHPINTDLPPFQTTTVVIQTVNPMLGATPQIQTVDGSSVKFLSAVRVEMHFLIYLIILFLMS